MSDSNAPEPTMEEILASIRRIISEDEPPAAPAGEPVAEEPESAPSAPAPALVHEEHEEHEDVLELTEPVRDEFSSIETHGDLEIHSAEPPAAHPASMEAVASAPEESLLSFDAATSAASSFSQLTQHVFMPGHGVTLEDVVRELLKPLLKSWLDTYLPGIVQAKVDEEVERIARRRVG